MSGGDEDMGSSDLLKALAVSLGGGAYGDHFGVPPMDPGQAFQSRAGAINR